MKGHSRGHRKCRSDGKRVSGRRSSSAKLRKVMRGNAHPFPWPSHSARLLHVEVVLADMDTIRAGKKSDVGPVIHDERDAPRAEKSRESPRGVEEFTRRCLFIPVLKETHPNISH